MPDIGARTSGASISSSITLPGADVQFTYNLDHEGNCVNPQHQPVGGTTVTESRTTNTLNQVATRNGVILQCDPNGNLLQDTRRKYQYDALNRLIEVWCASSGCQLAAYTLRLGKQAGAEGRDELRDQRHDSEAQDERRVSMLSLRFSLLNKPVISHLP